MLIPYLAWFLMMLPNGRLRLSSAGGGGEMLCHVPTLNTIIITCMYVSIVVYLCDLCHSPLPLGLFTSFVCSSIILRPIQFYSPTFSVNLL